MRSKCDTQVCLLMCDYLNVLPKSAHAMHLACFLRRLKPSHTRWNHLLTALSTSRCGYLWASCSMSSFCLLHPLPSFCNIGIGIYHLGKRAASLVLYAPTGPDGYHCGHCVSQWRPQRREVPWVPCIASASHSFWRDGIRKLSSGGLNVSQYPRGKSHAVRHSPQQRVNSELRDVQG